MGVARQPPRAARTFSSAVALVAIASQAACFSVSPTYEDGFLMEKIDRQYAVRDDCLRRTAARLDDGAGDVRALGGLIAQSCVTETRGLVALINPRGDPQVTARIVEDSASRATGYVRGARRAEASTER